MEVAYGSGACELSSIMVEADEFHMLIGYCIAEWARVDEELFHIFQACLGAPIEQCSILYYRISSIKTRSETVDEIVKSVLPKKTKPGEHEHNAVQKWKEIINSFAKLNSVRRRIAHYPVQVKYEMKPYLRRELTIILLISNHRPRHSNLRLKCI